MKGQETDQKITIKSAAEILGVSTKSIQRYLMKGLLTKVKEGTRTLLIHHEVKALKVDDRFGQGRLIGALPNRKGAGHPGDTVTLNRERYDALLLELGELRKRHQLFIECKEGMPVREEALQRLKENLEQLRERVDALERKNAAAVSTEARFLQESQGEGEVAKKKPKKPWWQV